MPGMMEPPRSRDTAQPDPMAEMRQNLAAATKLRQFPHHVSVGDELAEGAVHIAQVNAFRTWNRDTGSKLPEGSHFVFNVPGTCVSIVGFVEKSEADKLSKLVGNPVRS